MTTTRFTDGDVIVTLDLDTAAIVRQAANAASGGLVEVLEAELGAAASEASAAWYGQEGVTRRTGSSGDIEVVTTVGENEVRVSMGSTDLRKAIYVHRPGATSMIAVEIAEGEYQRVKVAQHKAGKAALLINAEGVFHAKHAQKDRGIEANHFYKLAPNLKASDGKHLLPELIRKPAKVRIDAAMPRIQAAIARQLARGAGNG